MLTNLKKGDYFLWYSSEKDDEPQLNIKLNKNTYYYFSPYEKEWTDPVRSMSHFYNRDTKHIFIKVSEKWLILRGFPLYEKT